MGLIAGVQMRSRGSSKVGFPPLGVRIPEKPAPFGKSCQQGLRFQTVCRKTPVCSEQLFKTSLIEAEAQTLLQQPTQGGGLEIE
jgi:hypothetical protein